MESVHAVSAVVVDAAGPLVAHAGDTAFPTFLRSAAKPFQALPLVQDGVVDRFHLTTAELALCCASHNSESGHIAGVRRLLEKIGCREADLACGPHRPLWRDMALASRVADLTEAPRTSIASNCSGKHAGMLALARHHGWPTAGYHADGHPVQERCHQEVARWASLPPGAVGVAVDGCGVNCFSIPLDRMALAFARLATSEEPAARAVVQAMTNHPGLVAGRGRLCTELMAAYPGRVLAKVGAEGVYGAALLEQGLGIAIKVEDGDSWASAVALIAVLDALKLDPSPRSTLSDFAELPIRNTRGETTGAIRATGSLTFK
ncbi:MAG: asparaginase [Gemmatimonadetes bacterium]|nr:asparaginase [Gemmatimonadota bacterium]